jgi:hypothetical protein
MNSKDFIKIISETFEDSERTLSSKGTEYSTNNNVFETFEKSVGSFFSSREEAALGFSIKHFTSITDMVLTNKEYSKEYIDEKFGDIINYMLLLKAMMYENNLENGN